MTDLPLSDELYAHVRTLLRERLGLHFPAQRRADLARALTAVAQEHHYADLGLLYLALIAGGPIWDTAARCLTIGETYFFRNGAQFAALRERILPDLLARRAGVRSLRLWSAGCATGEEPYSLAMTLADSLPADTGWQISVLGTDLNLDFLSRARQASYGQWSFRETTESQRERFFTPEGARWSLRPEIRRTVIFSRLNLAADEYPALINGTTAIDLIFCRNVLIYFDEATTRGVAERLYASLAPGGWLVVGHAEPNVEIFRQFETVNAPGTNLDRKPPNAPMFVTTALPSAPTVASPITPSQWITPTPLHEVRKTVSVSEPVAPASPPAPASTDLLIAARAAANAGNWQRAAEFTDRALVADPMRASAHFLRGQVYDHVGQIDAALDAYRRSLYLDPTFVMGALAMADTWRQGGMTVEARRGYRSALKLLAPLAPAELVPESDGTSVAELRTYILAQLRLLGG